MITYVQLSILSIVPACLCWQYFTSFSDWKMTTSSDQKYLHSEYYYGKCFVEQGAVFYTHTHFNHLQVLGKVILRDSISAGLVWSPVDHLSQWIRHASLSHSQTCQNVTDVLSTDAYQILSLLVQGPKNETYCKAWINVPRIPTCIILRATSNEDSLFRDTTFNFQICVPRITYCHTHTRYKYHYLEWYIPLNFSGGMDWDVYFFGPRRMEW